MYLINHEFFPIKNLDSLIFLRTFFNVIIKKVNRKSLYITKKMEEETDNPSSVYKTISIPKQTNEKISNDYSISNANSVNSFNSEKFKAHTENDKISEVLIKREYTQPTVNILASSMNEVVEKPTLDIKITSVDEDRNFNNSAQNGILKNKIPRKSIMLGSNFVPRKSIMLGSNFDCRRGSMIGLGPPLATLKKAIFLKVAGPGISDTDDPTMQNNRKVNVSYVNDYQENDSNINTRYYPSQNLAKEFDNYENEKQELECDLEEHLDNKRRGLLHSKKHMDWFKSRRRNLTKVHYQYHAEELERKNDLKTVFQTFDKDSSNYIVLEEFLEMFIDNYIVDIYSSHIARANQQQQDAHKELQKKIEEYLMPNFRRLYKTVTNHRKLALVEFVRLATNPESIELFNEFMCEFKAHDFGSKTKIEFLPMSFDDMIEFLSYRAIRKNKLKFIEHEKDWVRQFDGFMSLFDKSDFVSHKLAKKLRQLKEQNKPEKVTAEAELIIAAGVKKKAIDMFKSQSWSIIQGKMKAFRRASKMQFNQDMENVDNSAWKFHLNRKRRCSVMKPDAEPSFLECFEALQYKKFETVVPKKPLQKSKSSYIAEIQKNIPTANQNTYGYTIGSVNNTDTIENEEDDNQNSKPIAIRKQIKMLDLKSLKLNDKNNTEKSTDLQKTNQTSKSNASPLKSYGNYKADNMQREQKNKMDLSFQEAKSKALKQTRDIFTKMKSLHPNSDSRAYIIDNTKQSLQKSVDNSDKKNAYSSFYLTPNFFMKSNYGLSSTKRNIRQMNYNSSTSVHMVNKRQEDSMCITTKRFD